MNRTIFTTIDIMNIMKSVFKANTEELTLQECNSENKVDIYSYLNTEFYTYKNDIRDSDNKPSIDFNAKKTYALVETVDEEATISPDIDFVEKTGKITFLVQASKVDLLEYYVQKIRSIYIGKPEKIQNCWGTTLNAYLLFGVLQYDEEPEPTSLGKTMVCSIGFKLTYLTNALTYSDYDISMSFDGATYYTVPFNELSMQAIFTNDQIVKYQRSDLAGIRNKTCSFVMSISFYDFLKPLTELINNRFLMCTAHKVDNEVIGKQNINETIYVKIKINNDSDFLYLCTYDNIQKRMENASYSNTSLTLKGSAVDVIQTAEPKN